MRLERFPTAPAFLATVEPFLVRAEAENNLILGLARDLPADRATNGALPYLAAVLDGPDVLVAAVRTRPEILALTVAHRADALSALAADVHLTCTGLERIVAPEPTAGTFSAQLAALRGTRAQQRMSQRIHALRTVRAPERPAPGTLRQSREDELDALTPWVAQMLDILGDARPAAPLALERIRSGRLFVWEDDGPVSMAAWTGKTPHGVRVNFVFTPPAHRGRGYATACVAALSQRLLDRGNDFCCLYTDLANPTSNALYARIGYEPVCDSALYDLHA